MNFYVVQDSDVFSRFNGVQSAIQIIEEVKTNKLKWNFKNEYWFDTETKQILASNQKIHPNLPMVRVEFYLKK